MLRSAAVTRIQRILGFRSDLDTAIVDALKDAQVKLEEAAFLPWFLLADISDLATIADNEQVNFPADYIRESEDTALWYYDSSADEDVRWTELKKAYVDTLREIYQDTTDEPAAYANGTTYFIIKPTPDAVYVLKLGSYYANATVLSSDVENSWLEHVPDLLIGKAGMLVATSIRDQVAYGQFQIMERDGRIEMIKQDTARDMANQRLVMGGED